MRIPFETFNNVRRVNCFVKAILGHAQNKDLQLNSKLQLKAFEM
jgi:hypothetical protein